MYLFLASFFVAYNTMFSRLNLVPRRIPLEAEWSFKLHPNQILRRDQSLPLPLPPTFLRRVITAHRQRRYARSILSHTPRSGGAPGWFGEYGGLLSASEGGDDRCFINWDMDYAEGWL